MKDSAPHFHSFDLRSFFVDTSFWWYLSHPLFLVREEESCSCLQMHHVVQSTTTRHVLRMPGMCVIRPTALLLIPLQYKGGHCHWGVCATWVGVGYVGWKADKMQEGPLGATPHDNNKVRPSLATPSLHPLPSRPHTLTPPFRTGSLVILVSRFCDTNSSHFIQFSQMLFTEILCYVLCTPPPLQRQSDSVDRLHL